MENASKWTFRIKILHLSIYCIYTGYLHRNKYYYFLLSSADVSEVMTALLGPSLGQATPYLSKPYQTKPSGHFGPHQCQLSRCSTGQAGSPMKVTLEAGTVVKLCLHCPHRIRQLCPAGPSDLRSQGYLHPCWASSPEPPTTQPVHHKCRHVCPGYGPIPLSKRVQRISYKKK